MSPEELDGAIARGHADLIAGLDEFVDVEPGLAGVLSEVDLAAVRSDDLLLNTIGRGLVIRPQDDDLTRLLADWRAEIHSAELPELVDLATAQETIRNAVSHWGPVVASRGPLGPGVAQTDPERGVQGHR